MQAHAAQAIPDRDEEAERVIATRDFDGFLDQLMFNLYDAIRGEPKPHFINPTVTMYRRLDYEEPFDVKSTEVPNVPLAAQADAFMKLGISAAQIEDGRIPAAAFLVTMGYKTTPQLGTELDEEQLKANQQEVVIIAGATIDGRLNQAIYSVKREDKAIAGVDLTIYVPSRKSVTEKSKLENGLLAAFYQGYTAEYHAQAQKRKEQEGGERHGGFIVPE